MSRCYNCMQKIDSRVMYCPHCGYHFENNVKELYYLKPGTWLGQHRYMIGVSINAGGFGIVYKAWDQTFGKMVAIKEYFPSSVATRSPETNEVSSYSPKNMAEFEKGKIRFLSEARKMAKFAAHPNIVDVYDFFEEYNTAYMVMEFMDGMTYKEYIKSQGGKVGQSLAVGVTLSVLDALKAVHKEKIIHRDINPNNIFICKNGVVKIFDFGAARFEQTDMSMVLTPHYAPPEQYNMKGKQGPQTDIYAVGATMYFALTGIKPEESTDRLHKDRLVAPIKLDLSIPRSLSNAVMRAMALKPEIRFKSAQEFQKALKSGKKVRDAEEELKQRRIKRGIQFGITLFIFGTAAVISWCVYEKQQREATLQKTSLTVWVKADENDTEASAKNRLETMIDEFRKKYPQVTLEIRAFTEREYAERLNEAAANGELPDVFESTDLKTEYLEALEPLEDVYTMIENPENYYMLEEYRTLFPEEKQMPLCMQVAVEYDRADADVLETYSVRREDVKLYQDEGILETSAEEYIVRRTSLRDAAELLFHGQVDEYYSDTSDYQWLTEQFAGQFDVEDSLVSTVWPDHLWSIRGSADKAQKKAAKWMLFYMLDERAQNILTVQQLEGIPLNKAIADVFFDVYQGELEQFKDYIQPSNYVGSEWLEKRQLFLQSFEQETE